MAQRVPPRGLTWRRRRRRPRRPGRRTLVIGCGALGRRAACRGPPNRLAGRGDLPAGPLHNRPEQIPAAVDRMIRSARDGYDAVLVAYGDCGTGGALDRRPRASTASSGSRGLTATRSMRGRPSTALADEEPGTFYLTDFLARSFDRLVWRGWGWTAIPSCCPSTSATTDGSSISRSPTIRTCWPARDGPPRAWAWRSSTEDRVWRARDGDRCARRGRRPRARAPALEAARAAAGTA